MAEVTGTASTGWSEDTFDAEMDASLDAILAEDDSPDTPVAPTEGSPETADTGSDRGDGRDAKGRFAKAPGDADSPDTVGTGDPSAAAKAPDAPSEAGPTTGDIPATEAAKAPEADAPPEPFTVKHNGTEYEIPGAVITAHGIVIPTEQAGLLHEWIGKGLKFALRESELRAETLKAKQATATASADADAMRDEITRLMQIAEIADDDQLAVKAVEFFLDLRQQRPLLDERRKFAKEKAEWDLQRAMAQPDPETVRAQVTQQVVTTAAHHMAAMRAHPQYADLTDADWAKVEARVTADPQRYAYQVGPRPTAEEDELGLRPGDMVFDGRAYQGDVDIIRGMRQELVKHQAEAKRAIEAAKANAAKQAAVVPAAAPAAKPAPAKPAPASKTDGKAVWSKDAYLEELDRAFTEALSE